LHFLSIKYFNFGVMKFVVAKKLDVLQAKLLRTWFGSKVRELIAVKVLHTSSLNTTVVTFKVLPFGSYAPLPVLIHSSKLFWNWFYGMTFRAVTVLLLMPSMSSKCLPFNISFIFGNRKKSLGARSGE